jgi:hypothetical protein
MRICSADGLFAEDVEGLILQDVSIAFETQRRQAYWTMKCYNFSSARWPVNMTRCCCSH